MAREATFGYRRKIKGRKDEMRRLDILLVLSVLLLSACAQQTVQPTAPTSGNVFQISIKDFAFSPSDITIKVGDTVVWTNNDAVSHTVEANDGSFKSNELFKGSKFQFTFTKSGSYPYKCGIHPSMKGSVKVE